MNLPKLPKQNKQLEAGFGLVFRKWIEKNPMPTTATFELKDTRGADSFPYSELKDEQIAFANQVESYKGVLVRVQGTNGEADYIWVYHEPAFIVIKYPKFFCLIPIGNLMFEKNKSSRKSLTAERARDIATIVIASK